MEDRKFPQRTCVGCRNKCEKRDVIRIVRSPDGAVYLDKTGKAPGRGAYLCPRSSCLEAGLKKGGLARSLHISLTVEQQESIRKEFEIHAKGDT